jgi:aldose 1-epimerase
VVVEVPAELEVLVDDRQVPTGTAPVGTQGPDLRTARPLAQARLDTAFTELLRDADGCWRVKVSELEGLGHVTVWADHQFGWVQVFTAQGEDAGVIGSRGVAVEPMTCPADAFNSGDGLIVLEPGQSWSGTWGLMPANIS